MPCVASHEENLAEIEEKMTEADFKRLFNAKSSPTEKSGDDKIITVNEVVNVTLPIIDSTYVNHHLDKSLLLRYGITKILKSREAELWGLSPTPRAHLSAMLQRVHFQLVPTEEEVLVEHKKLRHRRNLRHSRRKNRRQHTLLRSLPTVVEKGAEKRHRARKQNKQAKLTRREKTDDFGNTKLVLVEKAKRELIINRPFMYALKCDDNFLQIGRYSSPQKSSNLDISNLSTHKKFVNEFV